MDAYGPYRRCECGKVRYPSRKEARKARSRLRGITGKLSAYRCDFGYWHLGHLPDVVRHGEKSRDDINNRYTPVAQFQL